jgi:hypothetical protein
MWNEELSAWKRIFEALGAGILNKVAILRIEVLFRRRLMWLWFRRWSVDLGARLVVYLHRRMYA